MDIPKWSISAWIFYGGVTLLGWTAVMISLWTVITVRHPDPWWFALSLPVIFLHRAFIQLPNCDGRICPSGLFVVYAALVYGPEQATLLALLDGGLNSVQQTRHGIWRLLFNLAMLPLAIFLTAGLEQWLAASDIWPVGTFMRSLAIALIYWMLNVGLVLGIMTLVGGMAAVRTARSALLWSWAQYCTAGVAAGLLALWGATVTLTVVLGTGVLALTYHTLRHYFRMLREREELLSEVRATHLACLETLAMAIEAKDSLTHGHVRRVQRLAEVIGIQMGIGGKELEALQIAALLHDIGKLAIPEYLLYRNKKLTLEDEQRLKSHARLGADILRHSRLHPQVAPIVRHHHECFDGSGYPLGLIGEQIPLGARVLAVADSYDKARHPETGEGLSRAEAIDRLRADLGRSLDPQVVEVVCAKNGALLEALEDHALAMPEHSAHGWTHEASFVEDFHLSHHENRALHRWNEGIQRTPELLPGLHLLSQAIGEVVDVSALMVLLPTGDQGGRKPLLLEGLPKLDPDRWQPPRWLEQLAQSINLAASLPDRSISEMPLELFREAGGVCSDAMILLIPLSASEHGLLLLGISEQATLTAEHLRIINVLLEYAGPAIAKAQFYERYLRESLTDALTGLANSRALREQGPHVIKRTVDVSATGCVVVLDLNGFKAINDTLGHHRGDRLLVEVARVLLEHVRRDDLVARNGGDEFVMVLADISPEVIEKRLESIYQKACALWPEGWDRDHVGTSAGVAWFTEGGGALDRLMELADARMYEDKRYKKSRQPRPLARQAPYALRPMSTPGIDTALNRRLA